MKIIERHPSTWGHESAMTAKDDYTLCEDVMTHERFFVDGLFGQPGEVVVISR